MRSMNRASVVLALVLVSVNLLQSVLSWMVCYPWQGLAMINLSIPNLKSLSLLVT